MQEVHLDKFIRLLDAPGIVPGPNSEVGAILRNCIHVQKLADPVTPVETILQRCNLEEVCSRAPGGCPFLLFPENSTFLFLSFFSILF
jgi:nuclear GTP-binding protein